MMGWLNKEIKGGIDDFERKSKGLPYMLVVAGIFIIITTPHNISRMEKIEGNLLDFYVGSRITVIIGSERDAYVIETKRNVESTLIYLKEGAYVELYTKKKSKVVRYLKIDDIEIINYSWYRAVGIQMVFIFLGSVLLLLRHRKV